VWQCFTTDRLLLLHQWGVRNGEVLQRPDQAPARSHSLSCPANILLSSDMWFGLVETQMARYYGLPSRWSRVRLPVATANTGPPQYFTEPPRPTQPPTLSGTGNEYRPKCGDVLRLVSKGMMAHCGQTCGWQVKLCDPSLTRDIPERY